MTPSDPKTRKSTSGYLVLYNGAPISWSSTLQSVVALSSTEAEYVAATEGGKEVVHLREVLKFLGKPQEEATPVYVDNRGVGFWAEEPAHHKRTRHMGTRIEWLRDQVIGQMVLKIIAISGDQNLSDPLTKATLRAVFESHTAKVMTKRPDDAMPLLVSA